MSVENVVWNCWISEPEYSPSEFNMRIGLNGYGQIGKRLVERLVTCPELELVAINDANSFPPARAVEFSSQISSEMGQPPALAAGPGGVTWRGRPLRWTSQSKPENLDWAAVGVDAVVEASRYFSRREMEAQHDGGRITVLMTGDLRDSTPDITLVLGINEDKFNPRMSVVCVGSDRTQGICPLMRILVDSVGIEAYQLVVHRPPYVWDRPQIISQPHQPQQAARVIPELAGIGSVLRVDDPQTRLAKVWLDVVARRETVCEDVVMQLCRGANRFPTAMHISEAPPATSGCTYSAVINQTRIRVDRKQLWIEMECDPVVSYVERMIEILQFVRRARGGRDQPVDLGSSMLRD